MPGQNEKKEFTKNDLVKDLVRIGAEEGDIIHLKVSMRAMGKIKGGANTFIEALLEAVGKSGTIIVDSFVTMYPIPFSAENKKIISTDKTPSYAGVFANAMIDYPGVYRSQHPIQKFTAIGAKARELMQAHTADSYAYDVLDVISGMGAKNLKVGPEHVLTQDVSLSMSIGSLGLKQKRKRMGVNYLDKDGKVRQFELNWSSGPCALGFTNFLHLYRQGDAYVGEGKLGSAPSFLTWMDKTLAIEKDILSRNPHFMFCNRFDCVNCRTTWEHSKGIPFLVHSLAYLTGAKKFSLRKFIAKRKK